MTTQVFFRGGNPAQHYTELRLASCWLPDRADHKVRVTAAAAELVKKPETVNSFPFIQVRTLEVASKETYPTLIYHTPEEGQSLQDKFELPPEVMVGTFFNFVLPGQHTNPVFLSPHWPEIVVPAWHDALFRWVNAPANSPVPDGSPLPWKSLNNHQLALPGVSNLLDYPYSLVDGKLSYHVADGQPLASFARPVRDDGSFHYLLLQCDGFIMAERLIAGPAGQPPAHGDFDKKAFASLLATPNSVYGCNRAAGAKGFYFNNLSLVCSKKIKITTGQLYYLRFLNHNKVVYCVCYEDAAWQKPLGWGRYNLNDVGKIRAVTAMLQQNEDYPPVLRALLGGAKS